MTKMPGRFRGIGDPRQAAEAAFKAATTKPVQAPLPPKAPPVPNARELVSLRLDREVLDHYQADGPGWQERINAALRQVIGQDKLPPAAVDEGLRPDALTTENDR